jgi:hypothetical protein
MSPIGLTVAYIAVLLGTRLLTLHYRRKLPIYADWKVFKSRLPDWVKRIEVLVQLSIWIFLSLGTVALLGWLHEVLRPTERAWQNATVVFLASFVMAWPLAALLANATSYAIPKVRRANLAAFDGLESASFHRANRELVLLLFGGVMLSAPFVLAAIFEPWSG